MPSRPTLAVAYRNAHYRIGSGETAGTARIGHRDPALDLALRLLGCRAHWCLLTPCNPRSRSLTPIQNRARLWRLRQIVRRKAWRALPALNASPDGRWVEPGLCLLDVSPHQVQALARQFGQLAWVLGPLGAPPQLVWTDRPLNRGGRHAPDRDRGRCGRAPAA